ncbi:hypothetical protein [Macrococcus armenti]|uniref:hypothetical protein n=1 Tax=Macrococcus armenti TaxID=2875764 RepID=UPI001CCD63BD|nr:hypothetical protein [Macrococcus armenti]UBH13518.1 hypothetical protein LAU43_02160 [Macrococcus armenti]
MEFKNEHIINVEILENSEEVYLQFSNGLDNKIILSSDEHEDLKRFFDDLFEFILTQKKVVKFEIIESEKTLYFKTANDIVIYLNREVEESIENFVKILEYSNL